MKFLVQYEKTILKVVVIVMSFACMLLSHQLVQSRNERLQELERSINSSILHWELSLSLVRSNCYMPADTVMWKTIIADLKQVRGDTTIGFISENTSVF